MNFANASRVACEFTDSRGISERHSLVVPSRFSSRRVERHPGEFSNISAPLRFRFRMRDARIFHEAFVTSRSRGIIFRPPIVRKVSSTPPAFFRIIENFRQSFKPPLRRTTVLQLATLSSCSRSSYRHEYCIIPATCSKSDSSVCCSAIAIMCVGEKLRSNGIRDYFVARRENSAKKKGRKKEEWLKITL